MDIPVAILGGVVFLAFVVGAGTVWSVIKGRRKTG
jgi:hypothetical protein